MLVPEVMPPRLVVGEVLPIGGVVPGVVLGVVPGVVDGVVPGVVLGVVPRVLLDAAPGLVVGMAAGVLGGQRVPADVVDGVPGMLAFGLFGDGLEVLMAGELEVAAEAVVLTGQVVDGVGAEAVAELGLVACGFVVADGVEFDCVPGYVGVGVAAPVWADCAIAIPAAKQRRRAVKIARMVIRSLLVVLHGGMAAAGVWMLTIASCRRAGTRYPHEETSHGLPGTTFRL